MPLKIKGQMRGETNEKRFYLPGVTFTYICPKCGAESVRHGRDHYLSYPTVGKSIDYNCCCNECEHEWRERVILRITVELAPACLAAERAAGEGAKGDV